MKEKAERLTPNKQFGGMPCFVECSLQLAVTKVFHIVFYFIPLKPKLNLNLSSADNPPDIPARFVRGLVSIGLYSDNSARSGP